MKKLAILGLCLVLLLPLVSCSSESPPSSSYYDEQYNEAANDLAYEKGLDVNVIISAIIAPRGTPRQVLTAWEEGLFTVVISEGIIAEVEEKLQDKQIGGAYGVTAEDVRWITALLRTQAETATVTPQEAETVTGDPEDDYMQATTISGRAQYLVTGDRGLLALKQHHGVSILNPRAFLDTLAAIHHN